MRVPSGDVADTAGDHDRLVIAAHFAVDLLLEGAKVAEQIRASEFIVERCPANRSREHDLERRRDSLRYADPVFWRPTAALRFHLSPRRRRGTRLFRQLPWLRQTRDAQMRHRESSESRLGLGTYPGRALVANLTTRTRGRTWKGRDGRWMIVRLDLHHVVRGFQMCAVASVPAGIEAMYARSFSNGGIVGIRDHGALRAHLVRVANHRKQRPLAALAIDDPIGIEDLVPAVFRVGLREHHQLDVRRVAVRVFRTEIVLQIIDLIRR